MKIVFLVRSLNVGGAERQLVELASGLHERGHQVSVKAFYGNGAFERHLTERGIPFQSLNKSGRWDIVPFMLRLVTELRKEAPDIIHGYLPVPNLLLAALKPVLPGVKIVWGIRASDMRMVPQEWISRVLNDLEVRTSAAADLIIVNSQAGFDVGQRRGIRAAKMRVVHNGIATDTYRVDLEGRARVRAELGLTERELAVGIVARLDRVKDHPTFLKAAAEVSRQRDGVRFLVIGAGPEAYRQELVALAVQLGVAGRCIWTGPRHDMPAVYSALDVACLCSLSEGFPNAVAEAMSCGRACVVTDAGDAAELVGDTGIVVAPGDAVGLARGLLQTLDDPGRPGRGERARRRIVDQFGQEALCEKTVSSLRQLLQQSP